MTYTQDLDPLNSPIASTLVAALPVLVLFYLLVARRWVASHAGAAGAIVAILIAAAIYKMPLDMACMSFLSGAAFGLLPIGWTVFGAMLIYNLTVETGQFAIIRRSIGSLSGDARIQAVLIGFCFGALMEGAAGSGSPVAICGAMLVGLGVPPLRAAVICLIANTSPVCYGGLGTPIMVLAQVTDIPGDTISVMCGHQLPFLSCLVPFYMVKVMCTWRQTFAVWPALAVGGGSFAIFQYFFATMHLWIPGFPVWPITDVGASIFSMISLALFLKFVWKPRDEWKFPVESAPIAQPGIVHGHGGEIDLGAAMAPVNTEIPLTSWTVAKAWSPFIIMSICLAAIGWVRQQETKIPLDLGGVPSFIAIEVPTLHLQVERAERLRKPGADPREAAIFRFTWLSAAGTPCVVAALLSALLLRTSLATMMRALRKTVWQMRIPIPTIACMLGLSYVTKYAGIDATLGVAFAATGVLYPFFAAILGWLGVFLTGTDAGSNALFGSLQKITAGQIYAAGHIEHLTLNQTEVLICTANSTGGVMGKMIDAQSICVATAGTNQIGREADIFKAVVWHSILLACIVGAMTAVQAYVPPFTAMVPGY